MTKEWIDLAIENWVRWQRQGMLWHRQRCLSIEYRYRSPQRRHWPSDAPPFEIRVVSVLAAQATEDAWKTLPFVPKMVLKQWYVLKVSSRKICRSLRRKGWPVIDKDFDMEISRARLMLSQALDRTKESHDNEYDAVVCVQEAHVGGRPSLQNKAA